MLEDERRHCHDRFCQITGRDYRYELNRYDWEAWSTHFTVAELELVLRWYPYENKRRRRENIKLLPIHIRNFIGDLQRFDDYVQDAKGWDARQKRSFQPTEREKVLAAWRHEDVQTQTPQTPAKRISTEAIIDALKNARQ